ncbi:hypothetical protein [Imhoffiella purpurea]|uniref:Uncharacterized protein n=1 Tax=Imhoffiella purpurea TaxID=1249627 RepID=W9V858_9GAMM|nr:hypothetical protein [Imhoffiella purpurea]EXJ15614.1 hypothetical protein D779_1356 [Imhoffiella purpurea]
MKPLTTLFSRRCCGGPVLALSLALVLFGTLFELLAASGLGWVFLAVGAGTLALCMLLGQSRCPRSSGPY